MIRIYLFLFLALPLVAAPIPLRPHEVAVLYNSDDPESRDLAEYYVLMRKIPPSQMIGLPLSKKESISREVYESTIRKPLTEIFIEKGWWRMGQDPQSGATAPQQSKILCLALMRGVPLKITRSKPPAAEVKAKIQRVKSNEASVDSELAMAGLQRGAIGWTQSNRYYKKDLPFTQARLPFMLMVGRIDAPTVDTCKRMIIDAIETEEEGGLWGRTYIDFYMKGKGYKLGDDWLDEIVQKSIASGVPTIVDRQANTLPTNYPMTEAAIYFGWYAHNRNGPFLHPTLKMKKGSIITHLHSFSAAQLRSTKRNWSAAILEKGAAATLGNVFEPYLRPTHHFNIFYDRLLKGYSLVESAYMAVPVLSWQNIVLGDPLYRPFLKFNEDPENFSTHREYKAMRLAYRSMTDPEARLLKLRSAAAKIKSGTMYEALGYEFLEKKQYPQATAFFNSAKGAFQNPADKIRQDLNLVELHRRKNEKTKALGILKKALTSNKNSPEQKSLIGLSNILNPPPPKPAKPKK